MKLIDADKLLSDIRESRVKNPHEDHKIRVNHTIEHDHIAHLVLKQPTAYDVDKVVEQLESILESVNIQVELSKDFQPKESESVKSDIVFFTEKKRLCEEFLKIVKSGCIVC